MDRSARIGSWVTAGLGGLALLLPNWPPSGETALFFVGVALLAVGVIGLLAEVVIWLRGRGRMAAPSGPSIGAGSGNIQVAGNQNTVNVSSPSAQLAPSGSDPMVQLRGLDSALAIADSTFSNPVNFDTDQHWFRGEFNRLASSARQLIEDHRPEFVPEFDDALRVAPHARGHESAQYRGRLERIREVIHRIRQGEEPRQSVPSSDGLSPSPALSEPSPRKQPARPVLGTVHRISRRSPIHHGAPNAQGGHAVESQEPAAAAFMVAQHYSKGPYPEEHRLPPAILAKPERHRAPDQEAFCAKRTRLMAQGHEFDEGLWTVSIDATHRDEMDWRANIDPWREACKTHHARFWPGVAYHPRANTPPVPSIPPWAAERQEAIRAHVRWLEDFGWGCDQAATGPPEGAA